MPIPQPRLVRAFVYLTGVSALLGLLGCGNRGLSRPTHSESGVSSNSTPMDVPSPAETTTGEPSWNSSRHAVESTVFDAHFPATAKSAERTRALLEGVAPPEDEWLTEAFSERAAAQLKSLAKQLTHSPPFDVSEYVVSKILCAPLRPQQLVTVKMSSDLEIRRWRAEGEHVMESLSVESALEQLQSGFVENSRTAFKIVRVTTVDDAFETIVFAEGVGRGEGKRRQWTATWKCQWTSDVMLRSIAVTEYEETICQGDAPWLVDVTESVLGNSAAFRQQLLYGMDHWINRLEHRLYVNRLGHHGLAIGDANGDGLDDLYVCQTGGLPNQLFLHQSDGTALEAASATGLDVLDDTTAALWVDLDNDGDQDLAILTVSGGFVFENDGGGGFSIQATMPDCRNAFSLTAADYDQDGLLDLYVGRYWPEESVRGAIPLPVPYYDALNGGANVLLRNEGSLTFRDVTRDVGLDVDNTRYTMAAAWEDFDNDGDQDLYVANDFGRNCLYRNDAGQFVNVAAASGVEDTAAGMSVSWSDYDHDGNVDLYVGNMFSSAGGRITFQRQYQDHFDADARAKLQRLARGNSLFRNNGDGAFRDVSIESATTMGRWAWGSLFVDINNDSWDDLIVANGHVSTEDTGDL